MKSLFSILKEIKILSPKQFRDKKMLEIATNLVKDNAPLDPDDEDQDTYHFDKETNPELFPEFYEYVKEQQSIFGDWRFKIEDEDIEFSITFYVPRDRKEIIFEVI